jgi:hypothetical protein
MQRRDGEEPRQEFVCLRGGAQLRTPDCRELHELLRERHRVFFDASHERLCAELDLLHEGEPHRNYFCEHIWVKEDLYAPDVWEEVRRFD